MGDSLLDIDLVGSVQRVCPDAPALVVDEDARRPRPGGAGLAALLAARAGEPVTLVTALADDDESAVLRTQLGRIPVVAGPANTPTPVKTRVRADGHTLARIDRTRAGKPTVTAEMLAALQSADAVLVSDYGRGLTEDPALRDVLTEVAARVPVVWDPHPRGAPPVHGVTLVTPNLDEAQRMCGQSGDGVAAAGAAASMLRARWRADAVAVTLGSRGALVADADGTTLVPAPPVAAADPCGAGDRFAVAVTAGLMRHDTVAAAVAHAVAAAARFVADGGAADITGGAFATVRSEEDSDIAAARELVASVRARGGTVVATGGCFDLLHAGHIRTLTAARGLGDCLVVCMNSDESVRALKGPDRPLTGEADRAEVLRALGCVDQVVVFAEHTPERVLAELRPDVWVKGGDYTPETLPETELVRGWGGEVVVVPYHDGRSTTRLAGLLTTEHVVSLRKLRESG
ncbi:D-glycero-beta-D-manno-heptose 1-phosphate adenylyltransferase [Actinophytocola algeriensis]|uniref:D-glycero-beta-D-manno-heptose 1-phosphate adenylyltransferase n=1 Tax=Actinophytocola algeriensis TaxID=1768010 RepID=A0A7W7Q8V6_9PSEU|nr:D-glycero-beta-D-manno-heptose 1-phosphate adenylyltransferase [Actinophytocola algeriensis]MBB4909144.1 rfaE bifunctional protein nucleotidyltransferase chain/domain [Actinophytocola algeriensis]MBE1474468.1 rfaE bifunctional protein nucleotidyltransferase chain/domain [Actinophytocola algeriensis]